MRMLLPLRQEIPGHPLHVIQRGRLRSACFFSDEDCAAYLRWLGQYAASFGCSVHAYVLMGNHVHLLLTPSRAGGGLAQWRRRSRLAPSPSARRRAGRR